MTIKETIEWLRAIKEKYIHSGDEVFDRKRHEAIDTAVFYLEKIEREKQESMSIEPPYPKIVDDIHGASVDLNEILSHGPAPSSFVINVDVCDDRTNSPNAPISNVGYLYFATSNQQFA